MTRSVRPDPDLLLVGALRAHLTTGIAVVTNRPDDFLERLPLVAARAVTADATLMVAHRSFAEVDVQSWAATRGQASDLDDACHGALRSAWHGGETYGGGRIARVEPIALGTEVRDPEQPGRLFRWQATYRLTIRPA